MRPQSKLDTFVSDQLSLGQRELASTTRAMTFHLAPRLAQALGPCNDAFLDPLLFAYFTESAGQPSGEAALTALLAGYIDVGADFFPVTIQSDAEGTIFVPRIGYFAGVGARRRLLLERDESGYLLSDGRDPVAAYFYPASTIPGSQVLLYRTLHPLFARFFTRSIDQEVDAVVTAETSENHANLAAAVDILRTHCSGCFNNLDEAVRGAVIYSAERPYSFAAMPAHGAVFLNAGSQGTRPYFLEDLVHQGSHVLFNAVTLRKEDFFRIDPEESLINHTGIEAVGSVYGAFHGLFTQMTINRCLDTCRRNDVFNGVEAHELDGRFSDNMKRFGAAIAALARRNLYTDLGWWMFERFASEFEAMYQKEAQSIERYDTSNQTYIFSYAAFAERNPFRQFHQAREGLPPRPEAAGAACDT